MVGSSWKSAEVNGVAPIRSPAEAKMVFGLAARRFRTYVARYSAPPNSGVPDGPSRPADPVGGSSAPWKSLRLRIWTSVVSALSTLSSFGSAALEVAAPTDATSEAATSAARATGVRRRRSPGADMLLLGRSRGDGATYS